MLQQDFGLSKQDVRFELQDAIRRLENIQTLSGKVASLSSLNDRRTPIGHRIPSMVMNVQACQELLGKHARHGEGLTFGELKRINPAQYEVFSAVVIEVKRLDTAIRTQTLDAFIRDLR
jgi:hypothetical protein